MAGKIAPSGSKADKQAKKDTKRNLRGADAKNEAKFGQSAQLAAAERAIAAASGRERQSISATGRQGGIRNASVYGSQNVRKGTGGRFVPGGDS